MEYALISGPSIIEKIIRFYPPERKASSPPGKAYVIHTFIFEL